MISIMSATIFVRFLLQEHFCFPTAHFRVRPCCRAVASPSAGDACRACVCGATRCHACKRGTHARDAILRGAPKTKGMMMMKIVNEGGVSREEGGANTESMHTLCKIHSISSIGVGQPCCAKMLHDCFSSSPTILPTKCRSSMFSVS